MKTTDNTDFTDGFIGKPMQNGAVSFSVFFALSVVKEERIGALATKNAEIAKKFARCHAISRTRLGVRRRSLTKSPLSFRVDSRSACQSKAVIPLALHPRTPSPGGERQTLDLTVNTCEAVDLIAGEPQYLYRAVVAPTTE